MPSILISIYILYKFIVDRQFCSHINNHSIIAMIIISFIDTTTELPITLQYLRVGYVQPDAKTFCLFWICVTWLSTFDWITNVLLLSVSIPFASKSLLARVLFQAKKMKRILTWRSTRKLTLQLMVISILYLLF
ncbi:unnamed protein product [Rotaria sp. Silwood2]|nr:unnamed protein product [Rotaria sp. Silwood2]CAF2905454.1 unnamed protein product [Rotaria sp. Silwood2]CAF3330364.1 unnamed protein product [Rotaria sp. Silwood2]CAF4062281.1 unnamed protein product [Rotaria sp. Silwood2]CAF4136409.1 unnamed protein product [Rotaria sp. Silwood2]